MYDGMVLWNIGCHGRVFRFSSFYQIDISELLPHWTHLIFTSGVLQDAISSLLLFNLYIHLLPSIVKHSLVVADDHTLMHFLK